MFTDGKYMKIQFSDLTYNAISNLNSFNTAINKNKSKEVVYFNSSRENKLPFSVPLSYYQVYLPNFTARTPRTCSSDNIELQEKSGDFKIAQFNNITCPSCGKKMMNNDKFIEITNELSQTDNDNYLEVLKKYKKYMRPVEESVFNEIYELSQKKGESKDIRTLLVSLRDKKLPILQNAQMRQVKKMTALSKTLPPDERMVLQGKIKKLKQHIKKTNAEAPFRRKILIDRISKIKIRNPQQYQKLQNIAKNFPTSYDMNSAWIVKYSGKHKQTEDWTSFEIAQRFLSSSVANTDHIIAYNIENNHDDISNYIAMHNACNSQKSNKPFIHWLYEDKINRTKFLQDYFDEAGSVIQQNINDKKYKNYVSLAVETINKAAKGKINLKNNFDL